MPNQLHVVQLLFGRSGAEGKPFRMAFDLHFPTQAMFHQLLSSGQLCEPPQVRALTEFLEPGDTFIDVGSHIGYFSLLALQMVGPTGSVFAFEPNHQTFSVLVANAMLNRSGNFYTFNSAVGDQPGTATFNINPHDEGMSSLMFRTQGSAQVTVHVTTLDNVAAISGIKNIRMLKIDVEGFEENVIKGAANLITAGSIENIVFEVNNILPGMPKGRDLAIRKFLGTHGYVSYLIRPGTGEQRWQDACGPHNYYRIPEEATIDIGLGNILATKRTIEAAT